METALFGKTLKEHRQKLGMGMTLNEVNKRTGISLVALSKYELGTAIPTDIHLQMLAELYNVSVSAFTSGEPVISYLGQPNSTNDLNGEKDRFRNRRRHRRGHSWENDEEELLQTVLQELKSGGTVKDGCRGFADQSGRALSSVTMYYFTNVRPKHMEMLEEAKREGKNRNRLKNREASRYNSISSRRTSLPLQSNSLNSVTYVALAMLNMTDDERQMVESYIQNNFTDLTEAEKRFASKTRISFVLDSDS